MTNNKHHHPHKRISGLLLIFLAIRFLGACTQEAPPLFQGDLLSPSAAEQLIADPGSVPFTEAELPALLPSAFNPHPQISQAARRVILSMSEAARPLLVAILKQDTNAYWQSGAAELLWEPGLLTTGELISLMSDSTLDQGSRRLLIDAAPVGQEATSVFIELFRRVLLESDYERQVLDRIEQQVGSIRPAQLAEKLGLQLQQETSDRSYLNALTLLSLLPTDDAFATLEAPLHQFFTGARDLPDQTEHLAFIIRQLIAGKRYAYLHELYQLARRRSSEMASYLYEQLSQLAPFQRYHRVGVNYAAAHDLVVSTLVQSGYPVTAAANREEAMAKGCDLYLDAHKEQQQSGFVSYTCRGDLYRVYGYRQEVSHRLLDMEGRTLWQLAAQGYAAPKRPYHLDTSCEGGRGQLQREVERNAGRQLWRAVERKLQRDRYAMPSNFAYQSG